MMRLFLAVVPPAALREELAARLEAGPQKPRGRWLGAEQLHLTLAFLGECPQEAVASLADAADRAAAGTLPFDASFGDLGAFASLKRARVAFLPLDEGESQMTALATTLHEALPAEFRPREKRRFRAHLTLARFREPPDAAALRLVGARLSETGPRRFRVEAIELLRSRLLPTGARYNSLHRARLGEPPGAG